MIAKSTISEARGISHQIEEHIENVISPNSRVNARDTLEIIQTIENGMRILGIKYEGLRALEILMDGQQLYTFVKSLKNLGMAEKFDI